MNSTQLLELYDTHERQSGLLPDAEIERTELTIRTIPKHGDEGWVMYSRLNADNADAAIQAEIARFRTLGKHFEWKWYSHDQPADLCERLAAHGFAVGEDEAIMALELAHLPDDLAHPVQHDVRRLTDPAQLADVDAVHSGVWENHVPEVMDWLRRLMTDQAEHTSIYVTYVDDQPACAAWINFPERSPFASLWGGATLPQFRQRGVYTATVAARAQEAIRRGYQFLTIDASPMSRPIVAKHGFQLLTMSRACKFRLEAEG